MRRTIISFFAVTAICFLTVGPTFAGTIGLLNDVAYTVTKEGVDGTGTMAGVQVGQALETFKAELSGFPLADQSWMLSLSDTDATLTDGTSWGLLICESNGGTAIAQLDTGDGGSTLGFIPIGNPTISNGTTYFFGSSTSSDPAQTTLCTAAAIDDLLLEIPDGTSSMSATISFGVGNSTNDTGTIEFVSVVNEFSASLTTIANNEIDFVSDFTNLYAWSGSNESATQDLIVLELVGAVIDWDLRDHTVNNTEEMVCTITASDSAAISDVFINPGSPGSTPSTACDDTDAPVYTCTWTDDGFDAGTTEFWINVNVDGTTTIPETSWVIECDLGLGNNAGQDRSDANGTAIVGAGTNAGSWSFRGTSIYVPLIKNNSGTGLETYFKFQSRDEAAAANQVRGIVLCDGSGSSITEVVSIGTITAGEPLNFTGTSLEALLSADCTVNASKGFAVILNITSDATDLFGLVTLTDSAGVQRRIPLSTDSPVSISGTFGGSVASDRTVTGTISSSGVSN